MQINVHVNGDAAIEQLMDAVELSRKQFPITSKKGNSLGFNFSNLDEERVVALHSQYSTPDQTQRMIRNSIIPSYFPAHILVWGDWHMTQTLGPDRAQRLSVAGEAWKNHMVFTAHLDSPILPPKFTYILSSLVNRKTKSGVVLGKEYKLPIYEALLTITKYSAFQIFEENSKGSIEGGMVADFVVLSEDPLKMAPENLINLSVIKTIKGDKVLYDSKSVAQRMMSSHSHAAITQIPN